MSYKFWKKVYDYSKKKMKKEYTIEHGCNSRCPRCKIWESEGNIIKTEPLNDYDLRSCSNCSYEWKAIFTPAGFIPLPIEY